MRGVPGVNGIQSVRGRVVPQRGTAGPVFPRRSREQKADANGPDAYALSLKQPWATLLVHGRKTIEVRLLVDAPPRPGAHSRLADPGRRPEVWRRLPAELREFAKLRGGIVGEATLTDCISYRDRATFAADREWHLNDPAWFDEDRDVRVPLRRHPPLPFLPYFGSLYFFEVDCPGRRPRGLPRTCW